MCNYQKMAKASAADNKKKIDELMDKMEGLNLRIASLEGKNLRTENELSSLKSHVEDLACRSMNHNLIFHGIKEEKKEDCKATIVKFLTDNMEVAEDRVGANCEIVIDIAHRIGRYQDQKTRPIVAMFTTRSAVEIIKSHGKNIQTKDYRVSEQLPREIRARRSAQVSKLKQLKDEFPGKTTSLVKDKLIHDNKVLPPNFSKNKIRINPNVKAVNFQDLKHTKEVNETKSRFQGHGMKVDSLVQVQAALNALYQDGTIANSTHIIYAYRIQDGLSGLTFTGHSDDGEWGAAASLAQHLEDQNYGSMFIAVSRTYGGVDLGQRRFALITRLGREVAELIEDGEQGG